MEAFLTSVLSTVDPPSHVQADPGSVPITPNTSIFTPSLAKAIASLPFQFAPNSPAL